MLADFSAKEIVENILDTLIGLIVGAIVGAFGVLITRVSKKDFAEMANRVTKLETVTSNLATRADLERIEGNHQRLMESLKRDLFDQINALREDIRLSRS